MQGPKTALETAEDLEQQGPGTAEFKDLEQHLKLQSVRTQNSKVQGPKTAECKDPKQQSARNQNSRVQGPETALDTAECKDLKQQSART